MIQIHSKKAKCWSKKILESTGGSQKRRHEFCILTYSLTKKNLTKIKQLDRANREETQVLGITATMHGNWLCSLVIPSFNVNDTHFQQLQKIHSEIWSLNKILCNCVNDPHVHQRDMFVTNKQSIILTLELSPAFENQKKLVVEHIP